MFKTLLIANRGEIACRVIATAQRLGIRTVAVYSDADANSRHVAMAHEAVHIGPPVVAESYLNSDRILEAALKTGAEAIHPGYGFLSENPDFVEAVDAAGLVFIGPSAHAIRAMGLKDAAKNLMIKAGVPVVPGYHGGSQDADDLAREAEAIGYPVLIKARAGGGGKGMRLVEVPSSFHAALEGAQREAESSFGDPVCLIEKFITQPRHVEIQVFGDSHGNVIHLFERDCSLQRRHQKVIEEAPAPFMPEAVRRAMGAAAVNAAKAIGYEGAGTIEFIADGSGPLRDDGFWFMEMNTRLQVEHPVSEAITGLDCVELQLRVAAGERLPVGQDDLSITGWAFEARLYAEDVPKGFLPATGRLNHLAFPKASEFDAGEVRVDSGIRQGDEVSPWYDPMIAKVIVHGPTRDVALSMLRSALEECRVVGLTTNLDFLRALSEHPEFVSGAVDTGIIDRNLEALRVETPPPPYVLALAAISSLLKRGVNTTDLAGPANLTTDPWDTLSGWRHWLPDMQQICLVAEDQEMIFHVTQRKGDHFTIEGEGPLISLQVIDLASNLASDLNIKDYRVIFEGRQIHASILDLPFQVAIFCEGRSYSFKRRDVLADTGTEAKGGDAVTAPMPGLVRVVSAKVGDTVSGDDPLVVLEAMKMEHTLKAPRDGTISEVLVDVGDQVTDGALLIALESNISK